MYLVHGDSWEIWIGFVEMSESLGCMFSCSNTRHQWMIVQGTLYGHIWFCVHKVGSTQLFKMSLYAVALQFPFTRKPSRKSEVYYNITGGIYLEWDVHQTHGCDGQRCPQTFGHIWDDWDRDWCRVATKKNVWIHLGYIKGISKNLAFYNAPLSHLANPSGILLHLSFLCLFDW